MNQTQKAAEFLKLHHGPRALVLVNVWDVASARIVESLGFPALATSSAGVANALGYPDGERIPREKMLDLVSRIAVKTGVPVSADLEAGYGEGIEAITETAQGLLAAGAVGLNFEDGTRDRQHPLADVALQVEKISAIRDAGERAGVHIVINARTDVYLAQAGEPAGRFDHAVSRLNAYFKGGADCLFVPGVQDAETIGRLVQAVEGPVNILAGPSTPPIAELEKLGVRRVSLGSWPMRAAMGFLRQFAREVREKGDFSSLGDDALTYSEINKLVT